jgi:hypothetical protein
MAKGKPSITFFALSAVAVTVLTLGFQPRSVSAGPQHESSKQPMPAYNPYPAGILPSNLSSETDRVLREVDILEGRALARWHALKSPILTGQPPVFQDTGTESIETLGELMLYDKGISPYRNEACASATCRMRGLADRFRRSI